MTNNKNNSTASQFSNHIGAAVYLIDQCKYLSESFSAPSACLFSLLTTHPRPLALKRMNLKMNVQQHVFVIFVCFKTSKNKILSSSHAPYLTGAKAHCYY